MTQDEIKADGGGLRYNEGKLAMDLIPYEWEEALAVVLTRGAVKYERHNWRRGMSWSSVLACARRHILAFQKGESHDESEAGVHHLAAAAWNLLVLMTYDSWQIGTNDLPFSKLEKPLYVAPGPVLQAIMDSKRKIQASPVVQKAILEPEVKGTGSQGLGKAVVTADDA